MALEAEVVQGHDMGEIVALGLESAATPSQVTSLSSTSAAVAFSAISIQTVELGRDCSKKVRMVGGQLNKKVKRKTRMRSNENGSRMN
ncbi:hypothetical protein D0Y65_043945 [Glycine soja]|uniref:Uncharacterized protein n=1 Tax=Glycine soja TaxID=3848 RepID=A0A445GJP5_GLYSO|nr:hypothetical protein D0Y65_043945 [Glycine soja]